MSKVRNGLLDLLSSQVTHSPWQLRHLCSAANIRLPIFHSPYRPTMDE